MAVEPAEIRRLIDAFEPCWKPPAGALAGWVVGIDPVGGCGEDRDGRLGGDLAVLAGAVLFHLVQAAGGVPVMTRADDCPSRGLTDGADVVVAIEFRGKGPDGEPSQRASAAGGTSGALTAALAGELRDNAPVARARPAEGECSVSVIVSTRADNTEAVDVTLPRALACGLCRGLIAFAAGAGRGMARGTSITPVPRFVDRPVAREIETAARTIWPDGDLPIDRAPWFVGLWTRTALSDRSFVYFAPRVAIEGDVVVVGGATNVACMTDTLVQALNAVGIDNVRGEMRLLPEDGRIGGHLFGACIATTALTYAEPSERAGLRTQLRYGEPLYLLDREGGFLLVHAADGYWGWVREECVHLKTADAFARYTACERAVVVRDLEFGARRIFRGTPLPILDASPFGLLLAGPNGATFEVSRADIVEISSENAAGERVEFALSHLHRPYVFGGVSPLGLDCSGLVQAACATTGVMLPRDAAQQFLSGRLVATRWRRDEVRPGDLLYFINACGRIFHVGMALDDAHFVHSGPPEVKIDSLRPGDRLYNSARAQTFLAARRL